MPTSMIAEKSPLDVTDLYGTLREMARRCLGAKASQHTLPPTALVHEAYIRLRGDKKIAHLPAEEYLKLASLHIYYALIDHERKKGALKRGGRDRERVPLHDVLLASHNTGFEDIDLLIFDEAIRAVATDYPEHVELVQMMLFGAMTFEEIATATKQKVKRVQRNWVFIRSVIRHEAC